MDLLVVEYYDHWQDESGWVDDHDGETEPLKCRSVGWVVFENDRIIRLCANLDENDRGFGSYTIMKTAIINRYGVLP